VTIKQILLGEQKVSDPWDVNAYVKNNGFKAFKKAREAMRPEDITNEIKQSGLTGRGGAGFPCGVKWELARRTRSRKKYLICNADEGEVGTFKDRYLIEHSPYRLLEGMCIAGLAIGAQQGYIYLRGEYHYLKDKLSQAVEQVNEKGLLSHMDIKVFEGAGAYVCGEESALMNSLEGWRGESRFKPPFPPTQGLWNKPTIINNVETLMNVPLILLNGASWFTAIGTQRSKGTKVFCVSGDVRNPGVYELEMGSSLKELVVDIAGAEDIKAVQVGGSVGNIVPGNLVDMPLSHETCLGNGAVVVFNSSRDIINVVCNNFHFLNDESCGKCTPCREGTKVILQVLKRLLGGEGFAEDIKILEDVSKAMSQASLCGLGQAASVPVLDSLKHFRDDYIKRISQSVLIRSVLAIDRSNQRRS
jgi:NADH-quinone oxidoreductase subunit F